MDDRDRKRAKKEKHAKERSSRPEKKVRKLRPRCLVTEVGRARLVAHACQFAALVISSSLSAPWCPALILAVCVLQVTVRQGYSDTLSGH